MTDSSLRQDVMDELDFEPGVDASHIGVAVENGVVTLSGHAKSYAEKLAAEAAAKRVKGVHAIAQEIEVRYPFEKKTADDEIAMRALNILRWNAVVPADTVQVKVQDGWITLTGNVDWDFQRRTAESHVRKLSGVAGVVNQIGIRPHIASGDVQRKIETALLRNAAVEAQNIKVSIRDGGKVSLNEPFGEIAEKCLCRLHMEIRLLRRAAMSTHGAESAARRRRTQQMRCWIFLFECFVGLQFWKRTVALILQQQRPLTVTDRKPSAVTQKWFRHVALH